MHAAGMRDPQAYIAYQKGLELYALAHTQSNRLEGLKASNIYFEQVISIAPEFSDAWQRHSDYFVHLLMNIASGSGYQDITADDVAGAPERLRVDLDKAFQYAPNIGRRQSIELDRAILFGTWRGISQLVERVLDQSDCSGSDWANMLSQPYGKAEKFLAREEHLQRCDLLGYNGWHAQIQALIWSGRLDEAVARALDYRKNIVGVPDSRSLVHAMIATGSFDEAAAIIERDISSEGQRERLKITLLAALGDLQAAEKVHSRLLLIQKADRKNVINGEGDYLHLAAQTGLREVANRIASEVDARPFGHIRLAESVLNCLCGAPFDLEETPNFARLIDESSLPWPPDSPINFPLKGR